MLTISFEGFYINVSSGNLKAASVQIYGMILPQRMYKLENLMVSYHQWFKNNIL